MSENAARRYTSLDGFRDIVRGVKDTASIATEQLCLVSMVPTVVRALGGKDSRLIEFVITTNRVDREQDVVNADGWDFKDYKNNPVVLWCHDHYDHPVGRSQSLTLVENAVKSICEFTPEDLNPFGYMTYRLYAEKFLHAVSVGFSPIEYNMAADRKFGINYIKQSLLEYSCCPVPANPDALAVARSKGINTRPMKEWAERVMDEKSGMSDDTRRRMEILRSLSSPDGRVLFLDLGETKMANATEQSPSASAIKRVDRWECGTKDCTHVTEADATACANFDVAVTDVTRGLQSLAALVKTGKAIKPEAAALLRSVLDEVAPAPAPAAPAADPAKQTEEGGEGEPAAVHVTEDEPETIELSISEEQIRAAVDEAIGDKMNQLTGRVD